jgi:hypothetical protein
LHGPKMWSNVTRICRRIPEKTVIDQVFEAL